MSQTGAISVKLSDWANDRKRLSAVRREVFIIEQSVPESIELDDWDPSSIHVVAENSTEKAVGTARLMPSGRIGRMAVLKPYRHRGIGAAMLQKLIETARERKFTEVHLHAQVGAIGFYEKFGFKAEGGVFLDAGIEHRNMRLRISDIFTPQSR